MYKFKAQQKYSPILGNSDQNIVFILIKE
jgi:hypothetical protein